MNAPVNKTKRKRHPNHRLAKIHRNYTVEEVTDLFGVHRNTVREWVKRGLPIIDTKRPMLILGQELGIFLKAHRTKNKQSCAPGEFYCLRFRAPESLPKTWLIARFLRPRQTTSLASVHVVNL